MVKDHRTLPIEGRTTNGFKACAPRLPAEGVCNRPRRLLKRRYIPGNVKRLYAVLGVVFIIGPAPPANLHIKFPKMLFSGPHIKGIHA